jgi:predicted transcriptional regulator
LYAYSYIQSMTPEQCRAARALLALKQNELAAQSGVSLRTIIHFEKGERTPIPANVKAMTEALEFAGVEFIDANGGGPGVRLKHQP